jgi:hypothetical protein
MIVTEASDLYLAPASRNVFQFSVDQGQNNTIEKALVQARLQSHN